MGSKMNHLDSLDKCCLVEFSVMTEILCSAVSSAVATVKHDIGGLEAWIV